MKKLYTYSASNERPPLFIPPENGVTQRVLMKKRLRNRVLTTLLRNNGQIELRKEGPMTGLRHKPAG